MKKIALLMILAFGLTVVFVTSANAEVLNVEIDTAGGLKKIDDSMNGFDPKNSKKIFDDCLKELVGRGLVKV